MKTDESKVFTCGMYFQYIPVVSQQRSSIKRRWQCNLAHLRSFCTSSSLPFSFSMGLWNCQSAVNKADLIPAIASQTALSILGLTETWIQPEDSATPAALSNNFFSHTPVMLGRVEVLVFSFLTIGNTQLILPYAIITLGISCYFCNDSGKTPCFVVMYRPPGQLGTFLEELDGLLSSFPEDGSPLVVFGDFNIHSDRPCAANLHSLLASFDLKRHTTTNTHKSGSQLDLICSRNCVADNVLVKPLHTSYHYFITFNLHLATSEPPTPQPVTFK